MANKAKNSSLTRAKDTKEDEFYTQLSDIEKEMRHYKSFFEGKTIYCNCDDPYESNFFKYFALNFNSLKLKKLVSVSYAGSPFAGKEVGLFENMGKEYAINGKKAYKVVLSELKDVTGDGRENLEDVKQIIKHRIRYLKGDGDFRSDESIELLKEADIIVTNPPFSLFREYIAQLMAYDKKFIILANQNTITYKEIFPLLKDNKMWLGYHFGDMSFKVPDYYKPRTTRYWEDETGQKWRSLGTICWYTNLDVKKRHETIDLYKDYSPEEYPAFDNYDAINVNRVCDIPCDYFGTMGVPITFMDKYNPDQFEICGISMAGCNDDSLNLKKDYSKYIGYKQNGEKTGRTGSTFGACPVLVKDDKKTVYYEKDGVRVQATYCRVFIKRKKD